MQTSDNSNDFPPFRLTIDKILELILFAYSIHKKRFFDTLSFPPPTDKINIQSLELNFEPRSQLI